MHAKFPRLFKAIINICGPLYLHGIVAINFNFSFAFPGVYNISDQKNALAWRATPARGFIREDSKKVE